AGTAKVFVTSRVMRATLAPIPRWRELSGLAFGRTASPEALSAPWRRDGENAGWLSRSAWSLALIARWRARQTGAAESAARPLVVWFPDFFCNEALVPLRQLNV